MEILAVKAPKWGNAEHTLVDIVLSTSAFTDYPYTASADAKDEVCRQLFADVQAGVYGPVAEFVPTPAPVIVPSSVTKAQGIAVLSAAGLWPQIREYFATEATETERELFAAITAFERSSPMLQTLAARFSLSEEALDQLFITGAAMVI